MTRNTAEPSSPNPTAVNQSNVADLDDPFLQQIAALTVDLLAKWLTQAILETPAILLRHAMLVKLLMQSEIPSFVAADATIDVIAIYPRLNEVHVPIDFHLHEKPTKACRKGRTIDGEATLIFLPGKKSILAVNFAEADRNDSETTVTPQISMKPASLN